MGFAVNSVRHGARRESGVVWLSEGGWPRAVPQLCRHQRRAHRPNPTDAHHRGSHQLRRQHATRSVDVLRRAMLNSELRRGVEFRRRNAPCLFSPRLPQHQRAAWWGPVEKHFEKIAGFLEALVSRRGHRGTLEPLRVARLSTQRSISVSLQPTIWFVSRTADGKRPARISRHAVVRLSPVRAFTSGQRMIRSVILVISALRSRRPSR